MVDISDKFVVVTVTQNEAKVWATGTSKGTSPEKIFAPASLNDHHHRVDPDFHGRGEGSGNAKYFEDINASISSASEILLVGHGTGKANAMLQLVQFLERKHPATAHKIVAALDENVDALTESQILSLARDWFASHPR